MYELYFLKKHTGCWVIGLFTPDVSPITVTDADVAFGGAGDGTLGGPDGRNSCCWWCCCCCCCRWILLLSGQSVDKFNDWSFWWKNGGFVELVLILLLFDVIDCLNPNEWDVEEVLGIIGVWTGILCTSG